MKFMLCTKNGKSHANEQKRTHSEAYLKIQQLTSIPSLFAIANFYCDKNYHSDVKPGLVPHIKTLHSHGSQTPSGCHKTKGSMATLK